MYTQWINHTLIGGFNAPKEYMPNWKLDHFPRDRCGNSKIIWNHHLVYIYIYTCTNNKYIYKFIYTCICPHFVHIFISSWTHVLLPFAPIFLPFLQKKTSRLQVLSGSPINAFSVLWGCWSSVPFGFLLIQVGPPLSTPRKFTKHVNKKTGADVKRKWNHLNQASILKGHVSFQESNVRKTLIKTANLCPNLQTFDSNFLKITYHYQQAFQNCHHL